MARNENGAERIMELKPAAKVYHELGLNIVPVKFYKEKEEWKKKPLIKWAGLQNHKQTTEEFESLPWSEADGLAIILGKTSRDKHICVVDLDVKNVSEQVKKEGERVFGEFPHTLAESTINGGKHKFYYSEEPVKTNSSYHNVCGIELLGDNKLCIMYPSYGYREIGTEKGAKVLKDANKFFKELMEKHESKSSAHIVEHWFNRKDLETERYRGPHPSCVRSLLKGAKEGQRNEVCIRLASYYVNFRRVKRKNTMAVLKLWNKKNEPPLSEDEITQTLKSAEEKGYVYGCEDPILKAHCKGKADCPLKKLEEKQVVYTPFMELENGRLAEEGFDGKEIYFLVYDPATERVEKKFEIELEDGIIKPIDNVEVRTYQVLLPSGVEEYDSEERLTKEILEFVNAWHEPPDDLSRKKDLAYIRLTYVQDLVPQVPYRRLLCDWGRGKDAWLEAVGTICYRPIFLAGSDTDRSLVRKLHTWRGTALINEADFSNSSLYSFLTKILNIGYDRRKGWYFRSSEDDPYGTLGYYVYSCKLLATRARYKDMALESRCITDIGRQNVRDIPLFRVDKFNEQSLHLRNKLILWRFRNYYRVKEKSSLLEDKDLAKKVYGDSEESRKVSSRVKQIVLPLWLIADENLRKELVELAKKINSKLMAQDWKYAFELQAKDAIKKLWEDDEKAKEAVIEATDKGLLEREGEPIPKYEPKIETREFDGETYYGLALSLISKKMITLAGVKEDEIERKNVISHSKNLRRIFESRLGFGFQIGRKNRRIVLIPKAWMDLNVVNVDKVNNVPSRASKKENKMGLQETFNSKTDSDINVCSEIEGERDRGKISKGKALRGNINQIKTLTTKNVDSKGIRISSLEESGTVSDNSQSTKGRAIEDGARIIEEEVEKVKIKRPLARKEKLCIEKRPVWYVENLSRRSCLVTPLFCSVCTTNLVEKEGTMIPIITSHDWVFHDEMRVFHPKCFETLVARLGKDCTAEDIIEELNRLFNERMERERLELEKEFREKREDNVILRVPEDPRRKDITEFLRKVMQRKED